MEENNERKGNLSLLEEWNKQMTGTERFKEDCPLRWEKSLVSSLKIMNGLNSGGNGRDSRGCVVDLSKGSSNASRDLTVALPP